MNQIFGGSLSSLPFARHEEKQVYKRRESYGEKKEKEGWPPVNWGRPEREVPCLRNIKSGGHGNSGRDPGTGNDPSYLDHSNG